MVAAGSGTRFGTDTPKQFLAIGGRSVLDWSLDCLDGRANVVLVVEPELVNRMAGAGDDPGLRRAARVVGGGPTRSLSVRAGLAAVPGTASILLVHDAARPFCSGEVVDRVLAAVRSGADAVVPGVAVVDTIKRVSGSAVVSTLERSTLVAAQTPQGFRASALRRAHATGAEATDDAALVEADGGRVEWVAGDIVNRKLTTVDDLPWFEGEARRRSAVADRTRS